MREARPSVHPDLARHQGAMKPKVYTLAGRIHCAFGYSIVNSTLIEGGASCILVDTMNGLDSARTVAAEFRKITDKPIETVVYTHFHADHVSGAAAFVSEEDVAAGAVEIVGQEGLIDHVLRDVGLIAPILGRRALYQFGMRLPVGEEGTLGAGLGPPQRPGPRGFVAPTRTFGESFAGETGGVAYEIHLIPSETEDQCAVWLPAEKALLSADAVYESFPNVYALRGTRFRNPAVWAEGIERLRRFGAEILVPHHGRPVEGKAEIDALLSDYRDAIQYLHDQTLRYMNKGCTPDEIAQIVVMPERLRGHPWLGEYYGSYKHSIPAIYAGYLGWFQGDPAALDPPPRPERARRYVTAMGGREAVLEAAARALEDGDAQWAAELATWPIRANREDAEARSLKASALRHWGFAQKNAIWRNWGLTAALELDGALDGAAGGMNLGSPEQVRGFPLAAIMRVLTVRLIAERCWETGIRVAFRTTDGAEACALEIRRGVCRFFADPPAACDASLAFDRAFLLDWLFGRATFEQAIESGAVAVEGDAAAAAEFLSKFEPFNEVREIAIAAR